MTNREVEQRIRRAVEHAAPDQLESILSSCDKQTNTTDAPTCLEQTGGQQKGAMIHMSENKKAKTGRRSPLAAIAAVAAAFVLCFGGYSLLGKNRVPQVDSIILLDVNPSLSLSVDADEKVVAAEALNEDAREIMGGMDLKGTSLEVAVNAIIGSMLQKGYLGDMQNAILVSVENADAARGEQLQKKVSQAIAAAMQTDSLDAAVLSQTVDSGDAALAELAKKYDISMGKASLIQEVIAQSPTLTFEELVPMTINDIALIASSRHVDSAAVTQTGTVSDKAYIGQEEALNNALAHAGVAAADIARLEIEFDSENGVMVYEVEFETASKEYEYDIDARTGEVLKYKLEENRKPASETDKTTASSGEAAAPSGEAAPAGSSYIGEAAAQAAALSHAGVAESDTKYIHCYIDYDDGRAEHYEVEFVAGNTEYEYEIDLYTGAVLKSEKEVHDSHEDHEHRDSSHHSETGSQPAATSYIGEQAALAAALSHAGISESDLTKKEIELDDDDGRMIYEIELEAGRMEYEYEIDAVTGQILKAETDIDD